MPWRPFEKVVNDEKIIVSTWFSSLSFFQCTILLLDTLEFWVSNSMIALLLTSPFGFEVLTCEITWVYTNSPGKSQSISPYRLLSCTAACLLKMLSRLLLKIMKGSVLNWWMGLTLLQWKKLQMLSYLMIVNDVKTVIVKISCPRCEFSFQFFI